MECIQEAGTRTRPKPFKVLAGDFEDNIAEAIIGALNDDSDGAFEIEATVYLRANELIGHAQTGDFDLVMLILNNMIFETHPNELGERVKDGMKLVSEIIHKYGLPVIALYGRPESSSPAKQMIEDGAIFAAQIPCDWSELEAAFYGCLKLACRQ